MPTRNINLTVRNDQFITEQIDSGRFANASEVLRAGLWLLEQQSEEDERKLTVLRKLAAEGFQSLDQGEGLSLSTESGLRSAIAKIGRRAGKPRKDE